MIDLPTMTCSAAYNTAIGEAFLRPRLPPPVPPLITVSPSSRASGSRTSAAPSLLAATPSIKLLVLCCTPVSTVLYISLVDAHLLVLDIERCRLCNKCDIFFKTSRWRSDHARERAAAPNHRGWTRGEEDKDLPRSRHVYLRGMHPMQRGWWRASIH